MTTYNSKGEEVGKIIQTVSDSAKNGNVVTATINFESVDTTGKTITRSTRIVKCENGVMSFNMKDLISAEQVARRGWNILNAPDVYIEYPGTMNIGDQLKDVLYKMDAKTPSGLVGKMKSTIEINITDRKVERKETVTTPAGTWDCYSISAKFKMTDRIKLTGIGVPVKIDFTEWFAPGFGVVKTESKTGKTEITSIR